MTVQLNRTEFPSVVIYVGGISLLWRWYVQTISSVAVFEHKSCDKFCVSYFNMSNSFLKHFFVTGMSM